MLATKKKHPPSGGPSALIFQGRNTKEDIFPPLPYHTPALGPAPVAQEEPPMAPADQALGDGEKKLLILVWLPFP